MTTSSAQSNNSILQATAVHKEFQRGQVKVVALDSVGFESVQLVARELADALVVQGAIATRSANADITGTVENIALAINRGSAAQMFSVRVGDELRLTAA